MGLKGQKKQALREFWKHLHQRTELQDGPPLGLLAELLWASLAAQWVKSPPAVQETWV